MHTEGESLHLVRKRVSLSAAKAEDRRARYVFVQGNRKGQILRRRKTTVVQAHTISWQHSERTTYPVQRMEAKGKQIQYRSK